EFPHATAQAPRASTGGLPRAGAVAKRNRSSDARLRPRFFGVSGPSFPSGANQNRFTTGIPTRPSTAAKETAKARLRKDRREGEIKIQFFAFSFAQSRLRGLFG